MNKDILIGNWKQLRGRVKMTWGRLTDNELDKIQGRRERLVGMLQEKYGYTRQQAERSLNDFLDLYEKKVKQKP